MPNERRDFLQWGFYALWVCLVIYLMPNPNGNWQMRIGGGILLQSEFPVKDDSEFLEARDHDLHEIHTDRSDFLSRVRSGEFEQQQYSKIPSRDASPTNETKPKNIFAVFAGRQRYLEILFHYVTKFLDEGLIDEVHLWDFCRKTEDADYIAGVASLDPRFVIQGNGRKLRKIVRYQLPSYEKKRTEECMSGQLPKWVRVGYYCNIDLLKLNILWKTMTHKMFPLFNQYYAHNLAPDDVLVKCDDDVLFIDNLLPLINYARSNPQISITYPSIVNNELSAYFQMRENMIPDPRASQLYSERWNHKDLVDVFSTLAYTSFYNEHSDEDYGPKLRTSWFQTYSVAWFLHDTFLKERDRFHSEAIYHFEAPTRVSINMFAMRGDTCRKFFIQSDFATDRLTDDEEALSWRMQKAFGTTNAFYFNTSCVHYSFSRQLLDLDAANKTFIFDYAQLALELGHKPLYQPNSTFYYGENVSDVSNPSANLIIGQKSVQIEALKALAHLKTGGTTQLAEKAKQARKGFQSEGPPMLKLNGQGQQNNQRLQHKPAEQPAQGQQGVQSTLSSQSAIFKNPLHNGQGMAQNQNGAQSSPSPQRRPLKNRQQNDQVTSKLQNFNSLQKTDAAD